MHMHSTCQIKDIRKFYNLQNANIISFGAIVHIELCRFRKFFIAQPLYHKTNCKSNIRY